MFLTVSRSSPALASPTFKEAFAHAQTLPFPCGYHTVTPLSLQGGFMPSPMLTPSALSGTGLDIPPTPPLRVPAISLMIPSTSSCLMTGHQSYFPVKLSCENKLAAPLVSLAVLFVN